MQNLHRFDPRGDSFARSRSLLVVEPLPDYELQRILHGWKSFAAKEANKILVRTGEFWQEEYFDHLIRNERDFSHAVDYVLGNPAKARLSNWNWISRTTTVEAMGSGTGVSPVK